jgi:hypothetical protein
MKESIPESDEVEPAACAVSRARSMSVGEGVGVTKPVMVGVKDGVSRVVGVAEEVAVALRVAVPVCVIVRVRVHVM